MGSEALEVVAGGDLNKEELDITPALVGLRVQSEM